MSQDMYIYAVIVLSAIVTYSIRVLGFIGAGFLKEDSQIFVLANYISYSLVGALVVGLLVTPHNALMDIPLSWRIAVALTCAAIYVYYRKHLLLLILMAVTVITLAQILIL